MSIAEARRSNCVVSLVGVYLGIIVIGVLAACAKWGSPRLLAYMASCAWFVSPALAFGVMLLVAIPSMKNDEVSKLFCSKCERSPAKREPYCSPQAVLGLLVLMVARTQAACVHDADVPSAVELVEPST